MIRYTAQNIRTDILAVMLILSLNHPMMGGISPPPETAMIINPEISFALSGYFPTVIEKISGNILATVSPMMNTTIQPTIGTELNIKNRMKSRERMDDQSRNL
jgi:hypothetical protein